MPISPGIFSPRNLLWYSGRFGLIIKNCVAFFFINTYTMYARRRVLISCSSGGKLPVIKFPPWDNSSVLIYCSRIKSVSYNLRMSTLILHTCSRVIYTMKIWYEWKKNYRCAWKNWIRLLSSRVNCCEKQGSCFPSSFHPKQYITRTRLPLGFKIINSIDYNCCHWHVLSFISNFICVLNFRRSVTKYWHLHMSIEFWRVSYKFIYFWHKKSTWLYIQSCALTFFRRKNVKIDLHLLLNIFFVD